VAAACTVATGDVRDRAALGELFARHRFGTVFHLAAQPIVGMATQDPYATVDANVRGTYTLLDACLEAGTERVVVASSVHAHGSGPYDVSKACADLIAGSFAHTQDMAVAVVRLANVYGGGDRAWSRLVPDTARALALGDRPVVRSDGTPVRDLVHVDDAVDAYLRVAGSLADPALSGRVWNVGSGIGHRVIDIVRRLVAVAGRDVDIDVRGGAPIADDPAGRILDATAIRDELGWHPRRSLDDGLAVTYGWYQQALADSGAPVAARG
jgi:CDP-glucose 4,6-dehydratase